MNNNLNSIEVECGCGKVHSLSSINFLENNLSELIIYLKENNIKNVRLFSESNLIDDEIISNLKNCLFQQKINLIVTTINIKHAEIFKVNNIAYENEEYLIIYGNQPIIDLIKYYAYITGVGYSFILYKVFYDFTFSKFARLYDGEFFHFYSVTSPEFIVFYEKNDIELNNAIEYLYNKKIAIFENLLLDKFEYEKQCDKINYKLKQLSEKISNITKTRDVLYLLIFIGKMMSFYDETAGFFGAEIDVANALEIITKKDFMECYIVACSVIRRTYCIALNSNLNILGFNINRRIGKLNKILNLPTSKILQFVKKPMINKSISKNVRIVKALKYMLLGIIEYENYCQEVYINKNKIEKSIYIAPEFSIRYTFLNLIRDIGYLEKLV